MIEFTCLWGFLLFEFELGFIRHIGYPPFPRFMLTCLQLDVAVIVFWILVLFCIDFTLSCRPYPYRCILPP